MGVKTLSNSEVYRGDERPWLGMWVVYSRRAREERVRVVVFVRVGRRWFMALDLFLGVRWCKHMITHMFPYHIWIS